MQTDVHPGGRSDGCPGGVAETVNATRIWSGRKLPNTLIQIPPDRADDPASDAVGCGHVVSANGSSPRVGQDPLMHAFRNYTGVRHTVD